MKLSLAIGLAMLLSPGVWAQDMDDNRPDGPPPHRDGPPPWMADGGDGEEHHRRPRGDHDRPSGHDGKRMQKSRAGVDRYLEHLKNENPEDYEKLSRMREEDPATFRKELRKRLRGKMRGKHAKNLRHPSNPEIQKLKQDTRRLSQAFHTAQGDEEKVRIKEELRGKLDQQFTLRDAERRKQVERMGKELEDLEERLASREAMREKIIERRLAELTTGDPLAW